MDELSTERRWLACCLGRGHLSPLTQSEIEALASELGDRRYAAGTMVFREGELPARVHVVREGRVELSKQLNGRRVSLDVLQAGDVFGDVPLFMDHADPFDARALDDSVILSIDADTLYGLLRTHSGLARRWFVSLAERAARLHERISDLLAGGLEAQIASLFLHRSDEDAIEMSQSTIAELLGTQRSSVNRVLKSMEAAGLIELTYRRIAIVDRAGLADLLERHGA